MPSATMTNPSSAISKDKESISLHVIYIFAVILPMESFFSLVCDRKIIGARAYEIEDGPVTPFRTKGPRDFYGHGTHVAATAAGRVVNGASYYGLAAGSAKGGSPASRIAVYRACSPEYGCTGSNILAAFDDSIADGVDVLSLSLGAGWWVHLDFADDPIALGAFHAVQHGITVVCSAGNDGPRSASVVNVAPWILTVAASTIDRVFESDIVLGGNKVIKVLIFVHWSSLKTLLTASELI